MFHGGLCPALDPTEFIHSISLRVFEVFSVMTIETQCFQIVERKKDRRISDVIHADVLLVVNEPCRPNDSFGFAPLTQTADRSKILGSAIKPGLAVVECTLLFRSFLSHAHIVTLFPDNKRTHRCDECAVYRCY
jgi:hypothetical protein